MAAGKYFRKGGAGADPNKGSTIGTVLPDCGTPDVSFEKINELKK